MSNKVMSQSHWLGRFQNGRPSTRRFSLLMLGLILLLAACGSATPGGPGSAGGLATSQPGPTSSAGNGTSGTALPSTVVPIIITAEPPDFTPAPTPLLPTATPIPALPDGFGPSELKYRILARYPNLFFCDPDYYPVARADEQDLARQRFAELQANAEEFNAMLAHTGLAGATSFSAEQQLLLYREHKRLAAIQLELAGDAYRFQLQVAENEGSGELVSGLIDSQGAITEQQREPSFATCPICLAAGTLIATPGGQLPVDKLRLGMLVWTLDQAGARVAAPLLEVGKTVVPRSHQVVHIVLQDGRELWASPGHPTSDGRTMRDLRAGNALDGDTILLAERLSYSDGATYDLLPAGATGFYWANGILMGSTLAGPAWRDVQSGGTAGTKNLHHEDTAFLYMPHFQSRVERCRRASSSMSCSPSMLWRIR